MKKMFKPILRQILYQGLRKISTTTKLNHKVCVCGAAGGIGQPLSLLLKINPLVTELSCYDVVHAVGVGVDLSHIDTACPVKGFMGPDQLACALTRAKVVVIPAGVPRKPGMTRDDLFNMNAGIVRDITKGIIANCPDALIAIITNPVNSTVPLAAEILKCAGCYDPRRLFGVTTLDVVRAKTFLGNAMNVDPAKTFIPVIGGHAGITILPVISQTCPKFTGCPQEIEALTVRIQDAGTEVVEAKGGAGSATLSMAYAAARFTESLLKGLNSQNGVVECAYVESNCTEASFFATPVVLGRCGLQDNLGIPALDCYETKGLEKAIPELIANIKKGVDFAKAG